MYEGLPCDEIDGTIRSEQATIAAARNVQA
jgi:hypothetical protein